MILPEERFNRFVRLVGKSGLERLQGACAMVVGVGAVGSFAVEAYAKDRHIVKIECCGGVGPDAADTWIE